VVGQGFAADHSAGKPVHLRKRALRKARRMKPSRPLHRQSHIARRP